MLRELLIYWCARKQRRIEQKQQMQTNPPVCERRKPPLQAARLFNWYDRKQRKREQKQQNESCHDCAYTTCPARYGSVAKPCKHKQKQDG